MSTVRPPAVAGRFYPAQARALAASVGAMLKAAQPRGQRPKALVVPHAGYVYSGPIAASAYAQLQAPLPTRVVLLGPAHFEAVRGLALPDCDALCTPLGTVPIDQPSVEALSRLECVCRSASAHQREHSLEVQLPFLQSVLPAFTVVPLAVGRASTEEVAQVLDAVWGGEETLIVISTDLSHYLPYGLAKLIDERTAKAIVACDPELEDDQACGAVGLRGLLQVAPRHRLSCALLDLRSSGDTAGDHERVVGYGAFALYPEARA